MASCVVDRNREREADEYKSSKGKEILTVDPGFWAAIQAPIEMCDATRSTNAISVGCSTSCIIFASCDLLLQLRNWHACRSFSFFWPIRSRPALISCFSSTAMPVAECQLPRGQEAVLQRTSSARGRGCHVLRVALGDNESLNYTLRILLQRPDEAGEDRRHVFFHIIVENDQAELKAKKLEIANSSSLHARTWPTVQHTRGLVLWQMRNDVPLAVRLPVPELLFPALEK